VYEAVPIIEIARHLVHYAAEPELDMHALAIIIKRGTKIAASLSHPSSDLETVLGHCRRVYSMEQVNSIGNLWKTRQTVTITNPELLSLYESIEKLAKELDPWRMPDVAGVYSLTDTGIHLPIPLL
jgi:hypothetical protein